MNYELFIGIRYLFSPRRDRSISVITWISIGGIALGGLALIVATSVMNGFRDNLSTAIIGALPHVRVFGWNEKIENNDRLEITIQQNPQVLATAPYIFKEALLTGTQSPRGALIRGIDPQREPFVTEIRKFLRDSVFNSYDQSKDVRLQKADEILAALKWDATQKPGSLPGIVLGASLAYKLGAKMGGTINLVSSEQRMTPIGDVPRIKKLEVIGIFESGIAGYDEALAFIDYRLAQRLYSLGPNEFTGIGVRIESAAQAPEVAEDLQSRLPSFLTGNWADENKSLFQIMKLEKFVLFLALTLIVLVAAFNIISSLTMLVMEKAKEIAILKTLGATDQSIQKIFVFQGMIIGVIGTTIGVCSGLFLCWILMTFDVIEIPPGVYPGGNRVPVLIDWLFVGLTAVSSFVICLCVTLYPATKAARLLPAQSLRYE